MVQNNLQYCLMMNFKTAYDKFGLLLVCGHEVEKIIENDKILLSSR